MKKVLDYTLILLLGVLVLGGIRENIVYASKKEVNNSNYNTEVSYEGREPDDEERDDIINQGVSEKNMSLKELTNKYQELLLQISEKI